MQIIIINFKISNFIQFRDISWEKISYNISEIQISIN